MADERRSQGTGSSGSDAGPWLLIGALALLWLAWPQIKARAQSIVPASQVAHALSFVPAVVAGLLVLCLIWALLRWQQRRRRRVTAALTEAVDDQVKKGYDPGQTLRDGAVSFRLVVERWSGFATPRRVFVEYPASSADRDPMWRAALQDVVEHRAGWAESSADWRMDKLCVRFTRRTPAPQVAPTREQAAQQSYETRAAHLLAPIFGVGIRVGVLQWEPATEADRTKFPEGYPSAIAIDYEPMTRDTSVNWRRRLESVVALKTPPGDARWVGEYDTAGDRIVLHHAPKMPSRVLHPGPAAWLNTSQLTLPYGVSGDGGTVRWSLTGPMANLAVHTLIIGATGGGKTTVIRSLLVGGTGQGVHVFGADPKRVELSPFRGWPGVHAVASDPGDIGELIRAVHGLMMERYNAIERDQTPSDEFDWVLFILDELLILRSALDRWWLRNRDAESGNWGGVKGTHHPALALLDEMVVLARTARIRLAFGVQRPDADLFERGTRDSVRHRISLNRLSQEGAKMLWGDPYTGTDLPLVPGRAMASPEGDPIETQTYWIPNPIERMSAEEAELMDRLRAASAEAFRTKGLPEGVDLSRLSARAITGVDEPPASPEAPAVVGAVVEHSDEITTQDVAADELVTGDRIMVDGDVQTVVAVVSIDDPDDPENSEAWVRVVTMRGKVSPAAAERAAEDVAAGRPVAGQLDHEGPEESSVFGRVIVLDEG